MINWNITQKDANLITKITKRAKKSFPTMLNFLETEMDITACHANGCPLNLPALLTAEKADFELEIVFILSHIDRKTGEVKDNYRLMFHKKTNHGN